MQSAIFFAQRAIVWDKPFMGNSAFLEHFREMTHCRKRRSEFVRHGRDEVRLQTGYAQFTAHGSKDEISCRCDHKNNEDKTSNGQIAARYCILLQRLSIAADDPQVPWKSSLAKRSKCFGRMSSDRRAIQWRSPRILQKQPYLKVACQRISRDSGTMRRL